MIIRKVIILLGLFTFVFNSSTLAEHAQKDIDFLINNTDPDINIGVKISNLSSNNIIYEKNAGRYYIPASSLKFIAVVGVINALGKDYNFISKLYNKGNDYFLSIEDPDFSEEDLKYFVEQIVKDNKDQNTVNISIINNRFTLPPIIRDKTYADTQYCYGAQVTRTHVNKNCARIPVEPGDVGKPIIVQPSDSFPYQVENKSNTIEKDKNDRLVVNIQNGKFIIDGTLSVSTGPINIVAVSSDNLDQIKSYLIKYLSNSGIKLSRKISVIEKEPKDIKEIASRVKNIKDLAKKALEESDNYITDYLLAEFATKNNISQWDWAMGELKKSIKDKLGVDLTESDLRDASGISRNNLLTVNQFDSFLKNVAKKEDLSFIKSIMATPGNGTLKERFDGVDLYAKTGHMTGVSALVGYFYNDKKELCSFVILINNSYQKRKLYRQLEEDIIKSVLKE